MMRECFTRPDQPLDIDRITNRFFNQFKIEHDKFLAFIQGIPSPEHRRWYASITLCRLMLVYFLQKKGLLESDEDYLSNRLHAIQERYGKGVFFSFYRKLLSHLFLCGSELPPALQREPGDIPHLNGGLLEEHPLERAYQDIQIADEAFEGILTFFQRWQWQLEDRTLVNDNAINPGILGHIFEKYTNQSRKELGAYYTKEDITGYIATNTIIPFLFDAAERLYPEAFLPGSAIWRHLQNHPDRYIYQAIQKGCTLPLPPEIEDGRADASRRTNWNRPAPPAYALPGETWREVVARRKQYENIRHRIEAGEIRTINDMITCNLAIHTFACDLIERCEDVEVIQAFYTAISQMRVLDPTCGSGSFLLAALNVLEPLYSACMQRLDKDGNHQFFLLKSIIANNIFGVDISREVVEVCKLRLFLKLISRVDSQKDLASLHTIVFNIRTGNALLDFDWFIEFHEIMQKGGFDVITGNPPYVEYENVRKAYKLANYATFSTGNLYALTIERCASLLAPGGRFGMIVPSSATCTDGYLPLQNILLAQSALHISSYSDQRGKLFDIPHPRLCIILYQKQPGTKSVFATPYLKLGRALRDSLFQRLAYAEVTHQVRPGIIPRYGSYVEQSLHARLHSQSHRLGDYRCKTGDHKLYYTRKLSWFVQVTPFIPKIRDERDRVRNPSELKTLSFSFPEQADLAFVALNSSLFYWFVTTGSDCRNLNMREVLGFPLSLDKIAPATRQALCKLATRLAADLQAHSELRKMSFKHIGTLTIQCLYPGRSKPIIDEIDRVLAQHYGFTGEELDFIINYDIKYRLGQASSV
ncbi:MAG TPA: DNA methyltransferase [Ktedonobacteraceae bacterium]|nr:DNA methyltransferase [Ktedonobacteraceae bacterium]